MANRIIARTKHPLYRIWQTMRRRCSDPNAAKYKYYGGNGITVCSRWESFSSFAEDMSPRPQGFSIDRIDNTKGYSPENCRWASVTTQNRNRSNTVMIELFGQTKSLPEWAEISGTIHHTIRTRRQRGWPDSEAVFGRGN